MAHPSKKVLVVDGKEGSNRELNGILRDLNYEVLEAKSAKEALQLIEASTPDLLVASADGDSGGYDLCKKVRSNKTAKGLSVVILSAAKDADQLFQKFEKEKDRADAYIKLPSPSVDIVDWVERLVGLPSPNGKKVAAFASEETVSVSVGKNEEKLIRDLQNQVEELQEQIHFYQRQLDQVSVTGEKESREVDQVLHDLQEDLSKAQKAKDEVKEELRLIQTDLAHKDQELESRERVIGDLREESNREMGQLRKELEDVRASYNEKEEKHKRALNALREYYKPKVAKVALLKKDMLVLEQELESKKKDLEKMRRAAETAAQEADKATEEKEELEEQLSAEQERAEKIKGALDEFNKLFKS